MKVILLSLILTISAFALNFEDIHYNCDKVLVRTHYTTCYNTTYKMPNYSFYKVTNESADSKLSRLQTFYVDPDLSKDERSSEEDYKDRDKGHLAPASLMDTDDLSRKEANYLSNIVPQDSYLNRFGAWRDVERLEQLLVNNNSLEIVSGAIYTNSNVPKYMYKVIMTDKNYVIFVFTNTSIDKKYKYDYIVTPEKFKEMSGVDIPQLNNKQSFTKEQLSSLRP